MSQAGAAASTAGGGSASSSASGAAGKKKDPKAEAEAAKALTPVVIAGDLPAAHRDVLFPIAVAAVTEHKAEKDQAAHIKKELEKAVGGMWHCIVGLCYGVSIANETKTMLFFRMGLHYILVFRTLDEAAHATSNAPKEGDDGGLGLGMDDDAELGAGDDGAEDVAAA